MNLSTRRHPLTALLMTVVMIMTSLPIGFAHAGMVSTETLIKQQTGDAVASEQAPSSRERLRDLLARDDVRGQMMTLGIGAAEADARLAALTDQEVADIAGRLDQLPAGEGVGSILVIIFIIFGVAVLMDALGVFDIFPFVCGGGDCGTQQIQALTIEPAAGPTQIDPYANESYRSNYRRDQFGVYDGRSQRGAYNDNQHIQQQELPQLQQPRRTRNYQNERYFR